MKVSFLNFALLASGASAFTIAPKQAVSSKLSMSVEDDRRSFLSKAAGSAAAVAFGLVQGPGPVQAIGGLKKVNAKLAQ